MISLAETLADQKDLDKLCQPKNENRFEIYSPNDNYGLAHAMKVYAGYPTDQPIYASYPHGMYLRDKVISRSELECGLGTHLMYPPHLFPLWKKTAKNKKVVPFAAPIHYILKQFDNEVPEENRKGTLFVPKHSTAAVEIQFDREAVIQELIDLPEEFHPITLCVHWSDVERGLHHYFQDAGFNVVCAGHVTDFRFIFRWLHLASQFKLLAGCGVNSSLFYGVSLGLPYLLTKEDAVSNFSDNFKPYHKEGKEYSPQGLKRLENLKRIFSKPMSEPTKEQKDLVDFYTNKDLIMSPNQLCQLFNKLRSEH